MWFKAKKGVLIGEGGGGTAPFKKIIRTNRSLYPRRRRGGIVPFKKVIRTNRSLCPRGGKGRASPHSKR